jgi:hypothetical protein
MSNSRSWVTSIVLIVFSRNYRMKTNSGCRKVENRWCKLVNRCNHKFKKNHLIYKATNYAEKSQNKDTITYIKLTKQLSALTIHGISEIVRWDANS